jgi:hypothetical protein
LRSWGRWEERVGLNTTIYEGSTLTGVASGTPAAWLDDERLLNDVLTQGPVGSIRTASIIVNPLGVEQSRSTTYLSATSALPLANGRVYLPEINTIRELSSGDVVWSRSDLVNAKGSADEHYVICAGDDPDLRIVTWQ